MPARPSLDTEAHLSTGAAARRCGVSRHTLLRAARRGDLPPARRTPGGDLRFRAADVEAFAAGLARRAPADGVPSRGVHGRLGAEVPRWDRLVEVSPDLMCMAGADGYFKWVSPAFTTVLGWSPEELLACPYVEFLHPEDRGPAEAAAASLRRGEPARAIENRYRCADGTWRWIAWTTTPGPGRGLHYAVGRDITERRQLEEALRANEARFRSAFEDAGIGMAVVGVDGRLLRVNPAFCALVGYTEDEMLRSAWPTLTHPDDMAASLALARRLIASQTRFETLEKRFIHKDGHAVWALLSSTLVSDGEGLPRYFISQIQDISARKAAESARGQAERRFRDLLESAPDAILSCDAAGGIEVVNSQAEALFGYGREELVGRPVELLLPEAARGRHAQHRAGYLANPRTRSMGSGLELHARTKDGRLVPVEISLSPLADGEEPSVMAVVRDVSARTEMERALRESEQRFRLAFDEAPTGMALAAPDGRLLQVNQALCRMLGYTEQELLDLRYPVLTHPDDLPESRERIHQLLAGEIYSANLEKRYLHKQGQVIWSHYTASLLRAADGRPLYLIYQLQDITTRKAAEAALRESEARFRTLVENAPVGACIVDEQGCFEAVNEAYAALFGYRRDELVGRHVGVLFDPSEQGHIRAWHAERMRAATTGQQEYEMIAKGGERLTVLAGSIQLAAGRDGRIWRASFVTDITAQKRTEQRLAHAAHHDALTGLPNRVLFEDRLEQAVHAAQRDRASVAVLLIDLDGFKLVNDRNGHAAGDALLRAVAARLAACIRDTDTAARLGGDEFGVLLPQAGEAGALRVACKVLAALAEPVGVGEARVKVGGSIGIALHPEHGEDAKTLMRCADAAMYAAKRADGGYLLCGEERDGQEMAGQGMGTELRRAAAAGELRVVYQPVAHCPTGRVVRAEALVRWEHPRLGLLPPGQFIPAAERTGAITALTVWALEEAIRQGAEWRTRGLGLGVAVNLSPVVLEDPQLPDLIAALLRRYGLTPASLTLEIAEGSLLVQPEGVAALAGLAALGVRLAIDDFGTGSSSIVQLRRLPVQELKLDRAFLIDLGEEKDAGLVAFLLGLGVALGMEVVAQGVETAATWEWLRAMHCELAQGYYVSRPRPAEQFEEWLRGGPWRAIDPPIRPSRATARPHPDRG